MFLIVSASDSKADFEILAVLADQIRGLGHDVRIRMCDEVFDLSRNAQFDLAPFLTEEAAGAADTVILVGGGKITETVSFRLRDSLRNAGRVIAIEPQATAQKRISVRAALSYIAQARPEILSIGVEQQTLPVFGIDCGRAMRRAGRTAVLIHDPDPSTSEDMHLIEELIWSKSLEPVILCGSAVKADFVKAFGARVRCYHHYEILPRHLVGLADVVVLRGNAVAGYRNDVLLANCLETGVPVLANRLRNAPEWVMRAPSCAATLIRVIERDLLADPEMVREELRAEKRPTRDAGLLEALGPAAARQETGRPEVIFMPTNGVGLGHAQRCSLISAQMRAKRPVFAAFPSCMRMLQGYGFDVMPLVARSAQHAQEHDNDLVNRARLDALAAEGGTFVFDGGYVFDSVLRVICDRRMNGIWIRRGMWQAGQDNSIALDREKIFSKVIVPSEAFEELNESYSEGAHVHAVGPIAQRIELSAAQRAKVHADLAQKYGPFSQLVVTMLGGGVAADRSVQTGVIANLLEARRDVLHLVVTWPTALVPPGLAACKNTHVVRTHHASVLAAVADLYISAVGYNSFHEAMYNRIPTIFMAQMNAFMDDQRKRAQSAVERGLADLVEPESYGALMAAISSHLDGARGQEMRAALAEVVLPPVGNAVAARLILGEIQA